MLTYFLFLQLGTAYESGVFNSAPSRRLGEKNQRFEALWDSRTWDADEPKRKTSILQSFMVFNVKCCFIYWEVNIIYICLNKIWILYCPFPFGTKDLKVLTNAETRPGLGQDGTSHTFFCHNHGTYDWICFHALWQCSLVLFERSFGWFGILLMLQKSGKKPPGMYFDDPS